MKATPFRMVFIIRDDMAFLIILLVVFYILAGASLGGYYYYLRRKCRDYYGSRPDLSDMDYLPVWIAFLWVFVAPLAFAIYFAQMKVESEEKE